MATNKMCLMELLSQLALWLVVFISCCVADQQGVSNGSRISGPFCQYPCNPQPQNGGGISGPLCLYPCHPQPPPPSDGALPQPQPQPQLPPPPPPAVAGKCPPDTAPDCCQNPPSMQNPPPMPYTPLPYDSYSAAALLAPPSLTRPLISTVWPSVIHFFFLSFFVFHV